MDSFGFTAVICLVVFLATLGGYLDKHFSAEEKRRLLPVLLFKTYLYLAYCAGVYYGEIVPSLPQWLILNCAVSTVAVAYAASQGWKIKADNISNNLDFVGVWVILTFTLIFGDRLFEPTAVDGSCMIFSGAVLGAWTATRRHAAAGLLIQVVMVVGYFALYHRLWTWEGAESPESALFWLGVAVSEALAWPMARRSRSVLPKVYVFRGVTTALIVSLLALRISS